MLSRTCLSATRVSVLIRALAMLCLAAAITGAATPPAQANSKYAGIVVDAKTGKVLYSDSSNARRYPASLTKIMTLYLVFEELEAGRLSLDSPLKASSYSSSRPPSKVGLRPGQTISVRDAIGALVTKSANDVAATVAENISGSEAAFARRMTATARRLGMRSTQFRNASGLPNSEQYTTARDMARLGRAIQERFPKYYKYFSMRVFTYKGRRYGNHNKLLGRVTGVDGIKTGYIRASGFNLVTSVRDRGRHVVAVVMGGRTGRTRDSHMRKLIAQYLPKASTGARTAPLIAMRPAIVNGPAPLPSAKPDHDAPMIVASIPVPPAALSGPTPPALIDEPQIAEGDTDSDDTPIEMASILPAPKAINAVVARAHAAAADGARPAVVRPSGWQVQIAAVPSQSGAMAMLREAQARAGGVLKQRELYTEAVAADGTTLYRARFVGFADKDAAWAACKTLKRAKYGCYAINP